MTDDAPRNTTPAQDGWYPDPSGSAQLRWFGEGRWTEHTTSASGPPAPAPGATVVVKKGPGCFKIGLIVAAVLALAGIGLVVLLALFVSGVSDQIDEQVTATISKAGQTSNDEMAKEAADLTVGVCRASEFGTAELELTVTNSSSKASDYMIEGVIELSDGTKVGDLYGFVTNVAPGQTGRDTLVGTVEGDGSGITCRIVRVDRSASL